MDRALKKFLSFPVFDQPFVEAICDVGLSRSEFWMVLDFDEDSGSRVFDMIPALPGSEKSKALLASRHDQTTSSLIWGSGQAQMWSSPRSNRRERW